MLNYLLSLRSAINQRVNDHGHQYIAFGIFGIIVYPIFYYISVRYIPNQHPHLYMRLIVALLCLPLIFHHYLPFSFRVWLPTYWYITLTYCLPFFFTVQLLTSHSTNLTWIVNLPFMLLWLMIFVDSLSFIILFFIGTVLGITITAQFFKVSIKEVDYFTILTQYIIFLALTLYFSHQKEQRKEVKDRTLAIKPIASGIAHEIRTPLASINAGAGGIKLYLPILLDSYQKAKEHNLPVGVIREIHVKQLNETLDKIIRETQYANTVIDMMLIQVNNSAINAYRFENISMIDCINEALDRYPFTSDTREKLIVFDKRNDFLFRGDKLLVIHIIFNLLKNAIYFIAEANKGKIYIYLNKRENFNYLYFKDTGSGVQKSYLNQIFNDFFSTTPNGSGIGLAFCKKVMKSMNGKIHCKSVYGEYTKFILKFPSSKKTEL